MGLFDFLKPKPKEQLHNIDGIGELKYGQEYNQYAYRGSVYSKSLGYTIQIILPTTNGEVTDYQKSYFKQLEENLKKILIEASNIPNSKIVLTNCSISTIAIPDKDNKSYDIDAEIVVITKDNIFKKSIHSLIMKKLNIVDIGHI